MSVLEFRGFQLKPERSEVLEFKSYCRNKYGGELHVFHAPEQLVSYYSYEQLEDHIRSAVGRVELALSKGNFELAKQIITLHEAECCTIDAPVLEETTIAEIGLSGKERVPLETAGIRYLTDLLERTPEELLQIHNINEVTLESITRKARHFVEAATCRSRVDSEYEEADV